jgi:hypothetical protein
MRFTNRLLVGTTLIALSATIAFTALGQGPAPTQLPAAGGAGRGQGGGGGAGGGAGRGAPAANLPQTPTAVTLPSVTAHHGPGAPYESVQSLAPGKGLAEFKYEAKEYFITGTANGQPYKTRMVIRKPASNSKFSGLVLWNRCIRAARRTCSK